jgi:hypothetical protein
MKQHKTKIDLMIGRRLNSLKQSILDQGESRVIEILSESEGNFQKVVEDATKNPSLYTSKTLQMIQLYAQIRSLGIDIRSLTSQPIIVKNGEIISNPIEQRIRREV